MDSNAVVLVAHVWVDRTHCISEKINDLISRLGSWGRNADLSIPQWRANSDASSTALFPWE